MHVLAPIAVLLPVLLCAGCGRARVDAHVAMVFAASSLSAAFAELAVEFGKRRPGEVIELHCAGTPQLVLQVREGAPVDVLASADAANMARVTSARSTRGTPVVFARNHLVIATRTGNPTGVRGLADLARADLRVLLCGAEVPAGRYARQALAKAGVDVRSVSDEPSVRSVVAKIALGEADAGIVYATDALAAAERVDAVAIAAEHDVVAEYPIAQLDDPDAGDARRATAAAFVAFVLSTDGQSILRRHGFASP